MMEEDTGVGIITFTPIDLVFHCASVHVIGHFYSRGGKDGRYMLLVVSFSLDRY